MRINTDKNCNIIIYDDTDYPIKGLFYSNSVSIFIVQLNRANSTSKILYSNIDDHTYRGKNPIVIRPLTGGYITVYHIILPKTGDPESYDPATYNKKYLKIGNYLKEDEINNLLEQIITDGSYQGEQSVSSTYEEYVKLENYIKESEVEEVLKTKEEEEFPSSSHTIPDPSPFNPVDPVVIDDSQSEVLNATTTGGYFSDGEKIYYKDSVDSEVREVKIQELIEVNSIYFNLIIFIKNFFSICYLRKCYISLCQKIFNASSFDKCFSKNKVDDSLKYKRDLVWAALNVIQYMIDSNQLAEAQNLLERIDGCNGLCTSEETGENKCGCNS